MKLSKKIFSLSCVLLFIFLSTASCEKKITKAECPFTTITWENSLADIKKLEGEPAETDDSGYDGLAYIYPKTYNGKDGYIYYMFDDKEKLVSLLWVYETPDSKDAKEVYEKIHSETEKELGESGFQYNSEKCANSGTPGDVWYLDGGNVITSMVSVSEFSVVQYQFLHPDVSSEKPES